MSYDAGAQDGLSFKGVVISFLYRLSEISAVSEPVDYLIDSLWAMLKPFTIEEDDEAWKDHATQQTYQSTMNKLRIISLILYRNGLLPIRDHIENRKWTIAIKKGTKEQKGLKTHVIEDIQINQFFMRHLLLISIITKRYGEYSMHMDILWATLSPYVTHEDYSEWEANNTTYGNPNHMYMYDPYMWNIEKIKICMMVMNRADFLWKTGTVDEPEEILTDAGDLVVQPRDVADDAQG